MAHERIWSGYRLKFAIFLMLAIAVIPSAYFFTLPSHIYPYGDDRVTIAYFDSHLDDVNLYVMASWYTVLGALSFGLSVATVFAIRTLSTGTAQSPGTMNADFRLFGEQRNLAVGS